MNPFSNPLDPFGAPGDPMEEVLSLQTYGEADQAAAGPGDGPIITFSCTISCPPKADASAS
jgi:hypothetical protein